MLNSGDRIGRYRIVEELGRGGMATVYKALQTGLDRYVALKVLPAQAAVDREFQERFQREAMMIASLRHPNILTIFDYGTDDGHTYLVSELVAGGTLSDRLGRPLAVPEVVSVLEPIASALDYAHQRGIIHRDVKPSNILLAEDGRPVLADFGIARMMDSSSGLTMVGKVVGTPAYMAPEQARGAATDAAVDRYALGIVAYEMLTGRVPFVAETTHAVLFAQVSQPPPPPSARNPRVGAVTEAALLRMLAKSPSDRFPTAVAFVEALQRPSSTDDAGRATTALPAATGTPTPPPSTAVHTPEPTARASSGAHIPARTEASPARHDRASLPPLGVAAPTQLTTPPPGAASPPSRTRRSAVIGLGAVALVALGAAGSRMLLLGARSRDRDDSPDGQPIAGAATAPPGAGTAAPARPTLDSLPKPTAPAATRVADAVTPTPRPVGPPAGASSPAPGSTPAVVYGTPPPGTGSPGPVVAAPALQSWAKIGSPSATWSVSPGNIATARATDGGAMLVSQASFTDVEILGELSTPNREASLAVRVQDAENAYLGVFVPEGAPQLKGRNGGVGLFKLTNGSMSPLALSRLPAMVQVRDTVRLRLAAHGQTLTLFLNSREVARVSDATFAEGKVGLRVFADAEGPCDATFANIRVGLNT
ncbi:MAG: serine/threonine protein kinase [Chloroflexi bacterium]|nr:serine/threonine protein kinase [Chloroflexota bacterium]